MKLRYILVGLLFALCLGFVATRNVGYMSFGTGCVGFPLWQTVTSEKQLSADQKFLSSNLMQLGYLSCESVYILKEKLTGLRAPEKSLIDRLPILASFKIEYSDEQSQVARLYIDKPNKEFLVVTSGPKHVDMKTGRKARSIYEKLVTEVRKEWFERQKYAEQGAAANP